MRGLIIGIAIIAVLGGGIFLFLIGRFGYSSLPCGGPCPGHEALSLQSYHINTPTNITLAIINTGDVRTSFTSYIIWSQSGRSYSNSSWSQPGFMPNEHLAVNVIIDGVGFTFQSGSSYTIRIGTLRNNEYVFSIIT